MSKIPLIIFCVLTILFTISVFSPYTHAVQSNSEGIGCGGGLGPIGEKLCELTREDSGDEGKELIGNTVNTLISGIVSFITVIAGLWFMIQFIVAGIQWISAGGDKSMLEVARNRMLHSVVGLVIVVSAWVIVGLIGTIVGLDILNPGKVISELTL